MRETFVEETRDFPDTWLSPVKSQSLKTDPSPFDFTQSPEYYRSLAGSPFDSSDSDSSSDYEDDAISLRSLDLSSTIRETPFSEDVSVVSEGLKTTGIMESNVLGLIFATETVATLAQQAEGLQAPRNHQGGRSCGRPNQKHHAQQEHVTFQSYGPTDETLVRRFPRDIGLWTDVSDSSSPKAFQDLCESPFEKVHSFGDGCDQPDTYDHTLRAPRMKIISLPDEQECDEDLLYTGSDLGGWLTGTLDGVPKVMLPELSYLDIGLPMPFAMEED